MGYCTVEERERFLVQRPVLRRLLIGAGIILIKSWFSISHTE